MEGKGRKAEEEEDRQLGNEIENRLDILLLYNNIVEQISGKFVFLLFQKKEEQCTSSTFCWNDQIRSDHHIFLFFVDDLIYLFINKTFYILHILHDVHTHMTFMISFCFSKIIAQQKQKLFTFRQVHYQPIVYAYICMRTS